MKPYILSLAAGLLVGIVYALLKVRSPAPPVIALIGLLGILVGEQIPPLVKQLLHRDSTQTTWLRGQVRPHVFGQLPQGPHTSHDTGATEPKA
ncbi:XapX domain-containing protein [Dyella sp. 2RAB6]|uniref:XapX domain-containing protein n=1 Tax=Dyella sp. 2RAB6 TaxID=3232992 RepID=UPI003F8DAD00